MPTARHLTNRQAWQDFLLLLVISHSLDAGQLYSMLPGGEEGGDERERKATEVEKETVHGQTSRFSYLFPFFFGWQLKTRERHELEITPWIQQDLSDFIITPATSMEKKNTRAHAPNTYLAVTATVAKYAR